MKKTTKAKITDYATTLFFMLVATVLTNQDEIMQNVPEQYRILIILAVGLLSQIAAEIRASSDKERGYEKGYNEAIQINKTESDEDEE